MSRRDFIKLVGISISSVLLTNCKMPLTVTLTPMPDTPRARLRRYWLSFGELAARTREASANNSTENVYGQELFSGHRAALDELIAAGEITPAAADLVHEAYGAALDHVYRSNNTLMTCYEPQRIDYGPDSAANLMHQSEILNQIAGQVNIDPQTLETARLALEHDMAFCSLSDNEITMLYDRILSEYDSQGKQRPSYGEVELEISPDDKAAAQFIIDILLGK